MPRKTPPPAAPPPRKARGKPHTPPPEDDDEFELPPGGAGFARLRPTELEGVFLNAMGVKVGPDGVALSLAVLKAKDKARQEEVLGEPDDSVLGYVKSVVKDPRTTNDIRLRASAIALPYTHRKLPQSFEGGGGPGSPIEVSLQVNTWLDTLVAGLPQEDADTLQRILRKAAEAKAGRDAAELAAKEVLEQSKAVSKGAKRRGKE